MYNGEQRTWPTGSAFADCVYAVPAYQCWPEKPCEALVFVQFGSAGNDWNQGDVKQAAGETKKAGGDAVVLPRGYDPSPKTTATRDQLGICGTQSVAVVVNWKWNAAC